MEWRRPFNTICPGNLNVRAAYRERGEKTNIYLNALAAKRERQQFGDSSEVPSGGKGVLRNILKQNKYSGNGTNIQQTSQIFSKLDKSI